MLPSWRKVRNVVYAMNETVGDLPRAARQAPEQVASLSRKQIAENHPSDGHGKDAPSHLRGSGPLWLGDNSNEKRNCDNKDGVEPDRRTEIAVRRRVDGPRRAASGTVKTRQCMKRAFRKPGNGFGIE